MAIFQVIFSTVFIITFVGAVHFSPTTNEPPNKTQESVAKSGPNYRLPSNVVPVSYKLRIVTHLEDDVNFPFEGEVEVEINITKKTRTIVLHTKKLEITAVPIIMMTIGNEVKNVSAKEYTIDNITDFLTIEFSDFIIPGNHRIFIAYQGVVNNELDGFYRTNYKDSKNKLRHLGTTQFQAIEARRAFPCFDEPGLKATFDISIKHRSNFHAVSNMHVIKTEVDSKSHKQMWTTFAQTPKMSTYTVAFVVSDFDILENDKLDFRVLARKNAIEKGEFALELGPKILDQLTNYTGISQEESGFKKIDCVAVPHMNGPAMENWGLSIFMEDHLLVQENTTKSFFEIQNVAILMAHELAHQWFGNLVTMSWWQYLWLNEGFANYFQYFITDKIYPQWRLMDLFTIYSLQRTFVSDSRNTSVAMNHAADSPKDIDMKFNGVSYEKASVIIRMISHILTESRFRKALMAYLNSKKFDVVTSSDLFLELKEKFPENSVITQDDFYDALVNWESNPGFPTITVTRNYSTNTATIEQERFMFTKDPSHNEKYWVALNYAQTKDSFDKTEAEYWMKPTDESITVPIPDSAKWAIFNKKQFGYYRVNYDVKNWQMIIDTLKSEKFEDIHVLNRAQLIDDALNLAQISQLDYTVTLELASYLEKEKDIFPWKPFMTKFSFIYNMLLRTEYHNDSKAFMTGLIDHLMDIINNYSNPDDGYIIEELRDKTQSWSCKLETKSCFQNRNFTFNEWLDSSSQNSTLTKSDSRVLCLGLRDADQKTWERSFERYLQLNDSNILKALACSTNGDILKNLLHIAMNRTSAIESVHVALILGGIYTESDVGTDIVIDFILGNYNNISGNLTDDAKTLFKHFLLNSELANFLSTQAHIDKLKNFREDIKDEPDYFIQAIDGIIGKAIAKRTWVKQRGLEFRRYFDRKLK